MTSVQSSTVQIKFKLPLKGKTYVWELIAEMYWCSNVESCKWMQQPIAWISEGNKKISWNKVHYNKIILIWYCNEDIGHLAQQNEAFE